MRTVSQETIKRIILNILRGPIVPTIQFSYVSPAFRDQRLQFNGEDMWRVANMIEKEEIGLILFNRFSQRSYHGFYDTEQNNLHISSDSWFSTDRDPNLFHECVHALHDMYGMPLPWIETEFMAYVAQAIYTLRRGLPLLRYMPEYEETAHSVIKGGEIRPALVTKLHNFLAQRNARRGGRMRLTCQAGYCYQWIGFNAFDTSVYFGR